MVGEPSTLLEAIRFFSDPEICIQYFAARRWPEGPVCPKCGGKSHYYLTSRRLWKCKACAKQFSVKVGTIFEDSAIGLDKWLPSLWMLTNDKNGISSYELHRSIGVCQKTAWFMLHRIRHAMQTGSFEKASGRVEIDETFVGGKARNMHKHVREQKITGTGGKDKTAVFGVLQRGGKVQAKIVANRKKTLLHEMVKQHVVPGAEIFTDALKSYEGLEVEYLHQVVDHAVEYVKGHVHTNGMENFWSLLKRTLNGTYISVAPFHLFQYVDEQAFRYNQRQDVDGGRFRHALRGTCGKRLTYAEVTGKQSIPGA
jgi:transposase-like protein